MLVFRINIAVLVLLTFTVACGREASEVSPTDKEPRKWVDTATGPMPVITDATHEELCTIKAIESAWKELADKEISVNNRDKKYNTQKKGGYIFVRKPDQKIPLICNKVGKCTDIWSEVPEIVGVQERITGEGYSGLYLHYVFVSRIGNRDLAAICAHERAHEITGLMDGDEELSSLTHTVEHMSRELLKEIPGCESYN